jgi:hypothetical protein
MDTTRYHAHFVLWNEGKPYEDYWVISDTRTGDRLLQARDERFARNMVEIMRTQAGWWD